MALLTQRHKGTKKKMNGRETRRIRAGVGIPGVHGFIHINARSYSGWKAKGKIMENEISRKIIGAAIEVHKTLGGPGLLESIYEAALMYELTLQGLDCQRQLPIPVKYKNIIIRDPLSPDVRKLGRLRPR